MCLDHLHSVPKNTKSLFIINHVLKHDTSANPNILFIENSFNENISIKSLYLYENNNYLLKRNSLGFFNCSRDMAWVGSDDFNTYVKYAEVEGYDINERLNFSTKFVGYRTFGHNM